MKKRLTLIPASIFFLLIGSSIMAQQVPYLYTYSLQPGQFNPAAQGIGGGGIGIVYRQQFMDLPSAERPQTLAFNADLSSLLKSERIGLGILLLGDDAHTLRRTQARLFRLSFDAHPK
ncbi:MAG: type IX secretion system membrane protein PorP/SprF [Saprospiraceae bacterium]|nr:type IX secretion system membrane protein PorP/SprF [Saprospiraceae bacterium]